MTVQRNNSSTGSGLQLQAATSKSPPSPMPAVANGTAARRVWLCTACRLRHGHGRPHQRPAASVSRGALQQEQQTGDCDDIAPFQQPATGGGVVLALGKFDALHRGHRALALTAAELGDAPVLLSFTGMAQVLGWPPRLPVVAPCDRRRVLATWSADIQRPTAMPLVERSIPFAAVRTLSPAQFVSLLKRMGVAGVVAGSNYRFGFKAVGDAGTLASLCASAGISCRLVNLVTENSGSFSAGSRTDVSSTAVRAALAEGDCSRARALLGRPHRLVLSALHHTMNVQSAGGAVLPPLKPCNQPPRAGLYSGRAWVTSSDASQGGDDCDCHLQPQAGTEQQAGAGGGGGHAVCGDSPAAVQVHPDGSIVCALLRVEHARAVAACLDSQKRVHISLDLQ